MCVHAIVARSGLGEPIEVVSFVPEEELQKDRLEQNKAIIGSLKRDPVLAEQLLKQCKDDAAMGRMNGPFTVHQVDLNMVTISPRFGVEQGARPLATGFVCCVMVHASVVRRESRWGPQGQAHRRLHKKRLQRGDGAGRAAALRAFPTVAR